MPFSKTIYLVRHGSFDARDPREPTEGKDLLPVGLRQAEYTGGRFASLGEPIDEVVCSDYLRARRTAEIIHRSLPQGVGLRVDPDLREIRQFYSSVGSPRVLAQLPEDELAAHPPAAAAAFQRYFVPPAAPRREILVCHGNVIAYFLSRLITLSEAERLALFIHLCSVTEIQIDSDGECEVVSICTEDHLPRDLQL